MQTKEEKKEYRKEYEQRPEVKARRKEWSKKNKDKINARKKKYRENNKEKIAKRQKEHHSKPEVKEKRKEYNQRSKVKAKRKEYLNRPEVKKRTKERKIEYNKRLEVKARKKDYRQRPEVKAKKNTHNRKRRKEDSKYAVCRRVRENFKDALKSYSTTGKILSSSKYLDMDAIIKHLTPFPKDRENYHIDHIIPLKMFDHDDPEQVKRAWLPSNLQWLPKEINLWKGDRLILPMTKEQKEKLLKKLQRK